MERLEGNWLLHLLTIDDVDVVLGGSISASVPTFAAPDAVHLGLDERVTHGPITNPS